MPDSTKDDLNAEILRLRARIAYMQSVDEQLENTINGYRRDLEAANEQIESLKAAIADIEGSNVWKATRPLVSLLHKAKSLRPQLPASRAATPETPLSLAAQYEILFSRSWPVSDELLRQAEMSNPSGGPESLPYLPKISLVLLIDSDDEAQAGRTLDSLIAQSYRNWDLSIYVGSCAEPGGMAARLSEKASPVKISVWNGPSSLNECLRHAAGEFVGLVTTDVVLWPNALFEIVAFLNAHPNFQFLYTDEDRIDLGSGAHSDPIFKPGWSPEYLHSCNYIGGFALVARGLLAGVAEGVWEGNGAYDLFLAISRFFVRKHGTRPFCAAAELIARVPKVLVSVATPSNSRTARSSLETDQARQQLEAEIVETMPGLFRTKRALAAKPLVSIIIPTKDKPEYIERCVESILERSTYSNLEILITDTGTTDETVLTLYEKWKQQDSRVRVACWRDEFNFSAVCNFGATQSSGEYLLFLNNDTEVLTPDWIEAMLEHAEREGIGSVGAKLLYPDGRLQHAGVVAGIGSIAGHYLRGSEDVPGVSFPTLFTKDAVREVACCTGACLMIRKDIFTKVSGFDESFRIAYNDVDLGLRLLFQEGLWNVFTPFAVLTHFESVSVGVPGMSIHDPQEHWREQQRMLARWGDKLQKDPFYHPLISLKQDTPTLDV